MQCGGQVGVGGALALPVDDVQIGAAESFLEPAADVACLLVAGLRGCLETIAAVALPAEAATGKWGPLVNWDIVPLHMHLLPTGKLLAWGKFEPGGTMMGATVWAEIGFCLVAVGQHEKAAEYLLRSGASVVETKVGTTLTFTVMRDPEGNPFCMG